MTRQTFEAEARRLRTWGNKTHNETAAILTRRWRMVMRRHRRLGRHPDGWGLDIELNELMRRNP